MTFTLRVPADEVEGSYSDVMTGHSDDSQEYRHREFEITPATATLAPQSTQDIQVLRFLLSINVFTVKEKITDFNRVYNFRKITQLHTNNFFQTIPK
jgi:hypothetical protein